MYKVPYLHFFHLIHFRIKCSFIDHDLQLFVLEIIKHYFHGSNVSHCCQNLISKGNQKRGNCRKCIHHARNWVCQIMLIKMYKLTHGCWTQVHKDKKGTMVACYVIFKEGSYHFSYFSHQGYLFLRERAIQWFKIW